MIRWIIPPTKGRGPAAPGGAVAGFCVYCRAPCAQCGVMWCGVHAALEAMRVDSCQLSGLSHMARHWAFGCAPSSEARVLAVATGLEPATSGSTVRCSAIELRDRWPAGRAYGIRTRVCRWKDDDPDH